VADTEKKPMISAEYRKQFAAKPKDWARQFVEKHCYSEEVLPEGSKKKARIVANIDAMVALAKVNGLDASKFNTDAYNTGQKIMNINNMLRAAAKKRHGLKGPNERFVKIDADDPLIAGTEPSESKDGEPLKAKPTKAAA
jgi:hypothetical protein